MLQGVASLGPLRRCRIDLDARRLFSAGWLENVLDRGGGYPRICWMSAFRREQTFRMGVIVARSVASRPMRKAGPSVKRLGVPGSSRPKLGNSPYVN